MEIKVKTVIEPIKEAKEEREERNLYFKAWKIVNEKYKSQNFVTGTPINDPTYFLERHNAARTGDHSYNKLKNTEEKIKMADRIYSKLLFKHRVKRTFKNLLDLL